MIEIRSILIPALTSAIKTATGLKVYDDLPIHLINTAIFPHVNISDIYVSENGPKNAYNYEVNILLEVVHNNISSLATLHSDMNKVLGIVNNSSPFALTGGYTIMDCRLNNTTTTKASIEKGFVNIGIIRLIFRIK